MELAALVYWLSTGISFDIACETLKQLKEQEPELFISGQGRRFMFSNSHFEKNKIKFS
jgi:hypothetical protein